MATIHMNFRSDCISRSVYPMVFLPDLNMWRDVEPPYPTLYFLNGYSGGGTETAMFTNIALYAMRYGVAVVLPDGENSFYVDDEKRGAMFSRFVGEELVEVTRSVLPLSARREDTWIGGISMGGYGALVNGLRFSERFSKIGMLSPALGLRRQEAPAAPTEEEHLIPEGELLETLGSWETYQGSYRDYESALRRMTAEGKDVPEMLLAIGREDFLWKAALDFRETCGALRAPLRWYEGPGAHDHTFWKQAMDPLFQFLTGKEDA